MVRRRVEIKKIEDRSKRQVTFTKRRQGLFKKAGELCTKCDAQIAVIAFSMAGNAYGFGDPSVQSVVNRYLATTNVPAAPPSSSRNNAAAVDSERLKAEKKVVEILGKVIDGGGSRLWDEEIAELGFDELEQLRISIEDIKKMIVQQESNE